MNATHTIDHLQAIAHVASLLGTGTAAVNKPKTAATTHYDPTGQEAAITSNTSYEGVTFAADGTISGGNLTHEASVPGGNKLSTTSVGFSNGKPGSADITVHNNNGDGDFKKIQMDMSGATWNNSFAISSGAVKMTTIDAATGQKKHDGAIQFANEAITTGAFTHYATDGSGTVTGGSQVDYSGTKFLGANLVGGQYNVHTHSADNVLKSTSAIAISELGRVQSIETTNMSGGATKTATASGTGSVTTKVSVDFSKITFNARNEFQSGEIAYTTTDNTGAVISKTTVAYNNANPTLSTTEVYKGGQLQNKVVIDYTGSLFNNDHQVVNSSKKVETYSGDGKLVSSIVVAYDAQGNKTKETTAQATQVKAAPPPAAVKSAPPPAKLTATTGDGTTQKTDNKYRSDNTLEQTRVTTLDTNGKPIFAVITLYAADGKTVTKTFSMDLSGLAYDQNANTVSGALNMQTHTGGTTLNAASTIQY